MDITVIIPAFNEEDSLPPLNEAIKKFNKVLLIDNYSTDRTKELGESYGWDHYYFKNIGYAEDPKLVDFYLSLIQTEWVYVCRADEIPSDYLVEFILSSTGEDFDALRVQRLNLLNGKKCNAWGNDYETPIFKKSFFRIDKGSFRFGYPGYFDCKTKILTISKKSGFFLTHNIDYSADSFFNTINRYSTLWTDNILQNTKTYRSKEEYYFKYLIRNLRTNIYKNKISTIVAIIVMPPLRFMLHYIFKKGYISGYTGLIASLFMMIEEYMICMKMFSKHLKWPQI